MSENKKTVVVYRSSTGFTKNYATWLAEELKCDLLEGKKTKASDLTKYDTIVYGGGLYAVGLSGIKLITKNFDQLKGKKIIIFAVGASPSREGTAQVVRKANIPAEIDEYIQFFYLRGGFDYNRLSPFMKLLMNLKKLQVKSVQDKDPDAKGFLASYEHPMDFTNKKYLKPILESIGGK
ncbi:MAG TPA: flavodoxin domain-containing protein [Mobilitalea sp.]|nr:flavodoxin domain-containing protein [Mobilitalea sp.]